MTARTFLEKYDDDIVFWGFITFVLTFGAGIITFGVFTAAPLPRPLPATQILMEGPVSMWVSPEKVLWHRCLADLPGGTKEFGAEDAETAPVIQPTFLRVTWNAGYEGRFGCEFSVAHVGRELIVGLTHHLI